MASQSTMAQPQKDYAIVEYLLETTSAIVPSNWLKNFRQGIEEKESVTFAKCYWPPTKDSKRINNLARKRADPHPRQWQTYDVKILNWFDTFDEGRKALKVYSEVPQSSEGDDSTDDEAGRTKKRRKTRSASPTHSLRQCSDSEVETSVPDVSSLPVNQLSAMKKSSAPLANSQYQKNNNPASSPLKNQSKSSPSKSSASPVHNKKLTKSSSPSKSSASPVHNKKLTKSSSPSKSSASPVHNQKQKFSPLKRSTPQQTEKSGHTKNASPQLKKVRSLNSPLWKTKVQKSRQSEGLLKYVQRSSVLDLTQEDNCSADEISSDIYSPLIEEVMTDQDDTMSVVSLNEIEQFMSEDQFKTPSSSSRRSLSFNESPGALQKVLHALRSIDRKVTDMAERLAKIETINKNIQSCVQPAIESGIGEDIPNLPLDTTENENKFIQMLKDPEKFNKTVSFLHGLGGPNAHDAVYLVMKSLYSDKLASTKSMKGIQRAGKPKKDAFMGTLSCKAVMCAVRKRFKDATLTEVATDIGTWLKDSPARLKKKEHRESRERERMQDLENFTNPSGNESLDDE